MATAFDPYQAWLGISPAERPLDYYRLLDVARFEGDAATIKAAAHKRLARVQPFLVDGTKPAAEQLITQIKRAAATLLNAEAKAKYDNGLRAKAAAPTAKAAVVPVAVATAAPVAVAAESAESNTGRSSVPMMLAAAAVVLLAAGGGVVWWLNNKPTANADPNKPSPGAGQPDIASNDNSGTPANPQTPATATADPQTLETVDLLPTINHVADTLEGKFDVRDGQLVMISGKPGAIRLRQSVPTDYELSLDVTRVSGADTLALGLVMDGRNFLAIVDWAAHDGGFCGLSLVEGVKLRDNPTARKGLVFKDHVEHHVVATVRSGSVNVTVDGKPVIEWKGDPTRLSFEPRWGAFEPGELSLRMWQSSFKVRTLSLKPLPADPATAVAKADRQVEQALIAKTVLAIDGGYLERSGLHGASGGGDGEDLAPGGGLLIGADLTYGNFSGHKVLDRIIPLYLTSDGVKSGTNFGGGSTNKERTEAKPGYAVGALQVRAGGRLDAIQFTYMRITPDGLDPSDAYPGPWMGGGGSPRPLVRSEGRPVVGLKVKSGSQVDSLGLVFADIETAAKVEEAPLLAEAPLGPSKLEVAVPAGTTSGPPAANAKPAELIRPADSAEEALAAAALKTLQTHCYRCHGENGASEGGLNFVLDAEKLVSNRYVVAGKLADSVLHARMVTGTMPPANEKVRPTAEEMAQFAKWIEAGAPSFTAPVGKREWISPAQVATLIQKDLEAVDENDRPFVRYFTLTHLSNAGLSGDELQTYRHGLSKLVNSLSWGAKIVRPTTIDASQSILRVDLRDYKWNEATWDTLLASYPYGVTLNVPAAARIKELAKSELPYVRADWFVATAALPPLYHDILELPETEADLEKLLRISVAENIRQQRVMRSGFANSGIARHNRIIERHETHFGAYWRTYDFGRGDGRKNVFAHPLGPGDDKNHFEQDGGELIFNLPNGLQAYMLVDAAGRRIDRGPIELVSDPKRPDRAVVNGVSCMSCHPRGINLKNDEVRDTVRANRQAFKTDELARIAALYPAREKMAAAQEQDIERFEAALKATGAQPSTTEPVLTLVQRFESPLDATLFAAELGVRPEDLKRLFAAGNASARSLTALRAPGGAVPRQLIVDNFATLAKDLAVGTPLLAKRNSRPAAQEPEKFTLDPTLSPEPKLLTTLKLSASLPNVIVSRDRKFVYVLNASDGKIVRISTASLKQDEKTIEAVKGAERMALTPDGKTLYVAGSPEGHNSQKETPGQIQVIDAEKFESVKKFGVPFDPWDLAPANNNVLYATSGSAQWTTGRVIDTRKGTVTGEFSIRQNSSLVLAHGATALYVCSGSVERHPVPPGPGNSRALASASVRSIRIVAGPDDRFLFAQSGVVLRSSKAPGADLKEAGKVDLWHACACDGPAGVFFLVTPDKQLKVHSYADLELQRQFRLDRHVYAMALDSVGGKLYCAVGDKPLENRPMDQAVGAGDLAIYDVRGLLGKLDTRPDGGPAKQPGGNDLVDIRPVESVAGKGTVADNELQPKLTLKLSASISELLLPRDRKSLFILNGSDGQLQRLDAATLKLDAKAVGLTTGADCAAISPSGKLVYVGASPKGHQVAEGKIQVIDADEFKTRSTFSVPFDPHAMVADRRGFVYATQGSGQSIPSHIIDPRKQVSYEWGQGVWADSAIRLNASEKAVYVGSGNDIRRRVAPASIPRDLNREETRHSLHALRFEITGDGKYLVGQLGDVLRLSEAPGADLKEFKKIEPHFALASDRGCNHVFVATKDKSIKVYSLPDFELQRALLVGRQVLLMKLDATTGLLYCTVASGEFKDRDRNAGEPVGDLAVFDVSSVIGKLTKPEALAMAEEKDELAPTKADANNTAEARATVAARDLMRARNLAKARNTREARALLEKIIKEYPETKAADEARELIKGGR